MTKDEDMKTSIIKEVTDVYKSDRVPRGVPIFTVKDAISSMIALFLTDARNDPSLAALQIRFYEDPIGPDEGFDHASISEIIESSDIDRGFYGLYDIIANRRFYETESLYIRDLLKMHCGSFTINERNLPGFVNRGKRFRDIDIRVPGLSEVYTRVRLLERGLVNED